ncbi:MAG TPA: HlyD family efflux transporter periplasmic adaptor subunit [Burkholderiales bacterium]|nr:HlyD family efflux transporter periplasmic adaptor subunit [Burkholderiales bacterium]
MNSAIQVWLDQQCTQIDGAAGGVVMLLPRGGKAPLAAAASWPAGAAANEELEAAAKTAYEREAPQTQPRLNGTQRPVPLGPVISHPIQVKGRTIGALAVCLGPEATLPPQSALESVERGVGSFETFMRGQLSAGKKAKSGSASRGFAPSNPAPQLPAAPARGAASGSPSAPRKPSEDLERTAEMPAPNSVRILHLLATLEAHEGFRAAATAFATELTEMFDCDRVAVGLVGRRHVKVEALSHSSEFKSNQGLLRDIGAAMEEAIWQGSTLVFPQPDGAQPRVDRAHATLASRHGAIAIYTIPLVKAGKPVGAITLERSRTDPLPRSEVTLGENIGALLGPLLEMKRTADRPWPLKIWQALREAIAPLTGPGHRLTKIVTGCAVALLAAAALISGEYRVSAPARLEGAMQRVLVAPGEGYLKQAHVRPGDRVKEGQLLAEMADEDLKLEQRKAQSAVAQLETSLGVAMVSGNRAEVGMLQARLDEARAQLMLVETQLERVRLTAPFDGVVITGDLTQSLGAPVKKGEALLTLAPEHDFRVMLEIDERDIGDVKLGQAGTLALAALPGKPLAFDIHRITPVATAGDGRNFFEVEARVRDKSAELRPGLQGVGKVEAGSRSLLWIWTHRVVGWIRLTLWSWIG